MRSTRLVIADRHPVVLQGLLSVLEVQNGLNVVASCSDGPGCIEAIRRLTPDIAILDIMMPGLTGLEILTIANAERLSTRLIFFTASVASRELVMSAAAGAYGVILKDVALEVLVQSLWQVARTQVAAAARRSGRVARAGAKECSDRRECACGADGTRAPDHGSGI